MLEHEECDKKMETLRAREAILLEVLRAADALEQSIYHERMAKATRHSPVAIQNREDITSVSMNNVRTVIAKAKQAGIDPTEKSNG